jgi:hypothetical protein
VDPFDICNAFSDGSNGFSEGREDGGLNFNFKNMGNQDPSFFNICYSMYSNNSFYHSDVFMCTKRH